MILIRSRYSVQKPSAGIVFDKPSKTIQSEYPQTTIDYYLRRYSQTGILGDPLRGQKAQYGDFSDLSDFAEMQNKVAQTKEYFASLPAEIRRKFNDDVNQFVGFVADPENVDVCVELGIFDKVSEPVQEVSPVENPVDSSSVQQQVEPQS